MSARLHVLLLHLDGSPAMPNLALMRVYAHHVAAGNHVELRVATRPAALQPRLGDPAWDLVYGSLIFEKTRPLAELAQRIYPGISVAAAQALGQLNVRDDGMKRRRIYTAWDGKDDEHVLFRGLHRLVEHGRFSPDMIMVYMLIGEDPAETHADRDYRRAKLRAMPARSASCTATASKGRN